MLVLFPLLGGLLALLVLEPCGFATTRVWALETAGLSFLVEPKADLPLPSAELAVVKPKDFRRSKLGATAIDGLHARVVLTTLDWLFFPKRGAADAEVTLGVCLDARSWDVLVMVTVGFELLHTVAFACLLTDNEEDVEEAVLSLATDELCFSTASGADGSFLCASFGPKLRVVLKGLIPAWFGAALLLLGLITAPVRSLLMERRFCETLLALEQGRPRSSLASEAGAASSEEEEEATADDDDADEVLCSDARLNVFCLTWSVWGGGEEADETSLVSWGSDLKLNWNFLLVKFFKKSKNLSETVHF